jgi:SAM-dependent methyltransferase
VSIGTSEHASRSQPSGEIESQVHAPLGRARRRFLVEQENLMDFRSDRDISRALAEDCARNICWMLDSVSTKDGVLALTGWALLTAGAPEEARFLVNGVPFASVRYPIGSPDLAAHFHDVANSDRARFECYVALRDVPAEPEFRFEFVQGGDAAKARRTAWWYPASPSETGSLDAERISRVIGAGDNFSFQLGGSTLFHRIEDYLDERFGLRYENLHAILDCGCGAGRLLSRFAGVDGPQVWGSDVDHDNLKHCRERLPFARCVVFPLVPPTEIADATFDLIVGISVCTHLSEANQARWLAELRRISRPDGLVLLSVQGNSQAALYRESPDVIRRLEQSGFVTKGVTRASTTSSTRPPTIWTCSRPGSTSATIGAASSR